MRPPRPGGHRVSGDAPSVDAMKDAGRARWIADVRFLTAKISVQVMMPRICL